MRIRILHERLERIGVRGDIVEMADREAKILVAVGRAEWVVDERPVTADAPPVSEPVAASGYSRRDMRAEKATRPRRSRAKKSPELGDEQTST